VCERGEGNFLRLPGAARYVICTSTPSAALTTYILLPARLHTVDGLNKGKDTRTPPLSLTTFTHMYTTPWNSSKYPHSESAIGLRRANVVD